MVRKQKMGICDIHSRRSLHALIVEIDPVGRPTWGGEVGLGERKETLCADSGIRCQAGLETDGGESKLDGGKLTHRGELRLELLLQGVVAVDELEVAFEEGVERLSVLGEESGWRGGRRMRRRRMGRHGLLGGERGG